MTRKLVRFQDKNLKSSECTHPTQKRITYLIVSNIKDLQVFASGNNWFDGEALRHLASHLFETVKSKNRLVQQKFWNNN